MVRAVAQLDTFAGPIPDPNAHASIPMWHESLWPVDWLTLRLSSVYYGVGVPRGDGSPVVLVPGFLFNDTYLLEMYGWLGRVGYRPYMSGIGINAECPGVLTQRLLNTVQQVHAETGQRVRIIGHSLGGVIGRRVSLHHPELVSQLVYLGSPLQAVHVHPAIAATAVLLHTTLSLLSAQNPHCLTDRCPCGFMNDGEKLLPQAVSHAAIYTRGDGVVDWHDAQEREPGLNYEVGGTHIGLVYNPRAYRVLGRLLATPPAVARPRLRIVA